MRSSQVVLHYFLLIATVLLPGVLHAQSKKIWVIRACYKSGSLLLSIFYPGSLTVVCPHFSHFLYASDETAVDPDYGPSDVGCALAG